MEVEERRQGGRVGFELKRWRQKREDQVEKRRQCVWRKA